jgi:AraC-like DNA-binding protein
VSYLELLPCPPLRPLLRCCWSVRGVQAAGAAPWRVLPDGCADLLFDLGASPPQAHWIGTMTRAVQVPAACGTLDLFGLRFAPGGLHAVLGVPLSDCTDRRVAVDLWAGLWTRDLLARLAERPSLTARLHCVETALLRVRPDTDALRGVTALDALHRGPLPSRVGDLASRWGLTERTLERRFDAWLGVRPKQHLRYLRFERLLPRLLAGEPCAALAVDCGYVDQSHLIRDVQAFAGTSPGALQREFAQRSRG